MPSFRSGKPRFRALTVVIAVAVILGAVGLTIFGIKRAGIEHVAAIPTPAPQIAAVALAKRRDLSNEITLVADFHPYNVVDLFAKQTGYLQNIYVDYGSRVSAGETIATLDLPEEQDQYAQTEAAYKFAKIDYDRIRSVVRAEPGLLAQEEVDKSQAAYQEAKDERDRASVMTGYANITAPFSGVVTKRYADPGGLIQAGTSSGTSPIVQLSDNYRLRLVVDVPESVVPKVHVGMPVTITVESTGQHLIGNVARYSYDVHTTTRTMHTEIDVPNDDLSLKPGMYASATIVLEKKAGVLTVPTQSLSTTGERPNVWVVGANDRLDQRTVTTGLETSDWVEILSGLRAGDRVFIGNRSELSEGDEVVPKVMQSAATSGT